MPKLLFYAVVLVLLFGCAEKGLIFKSSGPVSDPGHSWAFLTPVIENKIAVEDKIYQIQLPPSFVNKKVAYGDIFFGGANDFPRPKVIFFLVRSYDEPSPIVVFDLNGNLDFSDDSLFEITPEKPFDVIFKDPDDLKARGVNRFWLLDSAKERGHVLYQMDSARKGQRPLSYCFGEQRLAFRKVKLADGNLITLWDWNFNGRFDEKVDKVISGDISQDSFSLVRNNPMLTKSATSNDVLPYVNNSYKLLDVDSYGEDVKLKPLNKVISMLETLPPFSYKDTNEKSSKFSPDTSQDFSILYFWGAWCVGCRSQSPYLVKLIDSLPSVKLYTFNYGDKKERMLGYIKHHSFPFQPNMVNNKTVNDLFVTGYPTFIVLNKKGEVLLRTMNVGLVKHYLGKNMNK